MDLNEDDVLKILKLIDESPFDYFQLEVGDLKITVNKGEPITMGSSAQAAPLSPAPSLAPVQQAKAQPVAPVAEPKRETPKAEARIAEGLVPVTAPLLGTFYVAPEPGALPFVQVGGFVDAETTVGLIEVMKVFNSVRAGVKGVIAEIVVQNGQFVEYGQTLYLVRPQ